MCVGLLHSMQGGGIWSPIPSGALGDAGSGLACKGLKDGQFICYKSKCPTYYFLASKENSMGT